MQTSRHRWLPGLAALVALAFCFLAFRSPATVINVLASDSPVTVYTKIESARAGDEVIIAPGTYTNRVHLTAIGSVTNPIVIRAQDPNNKPVWDFSTTYVENAPGSYTAGDKGRGGWQIIGGAYYHISGIVFSGCHTAGSYNSAGIRYFFGAQGLYLKDCIFRDNDNGITGGNGTSSGYPDSDATVEFCEFDHNGNLLATSPTHNMYIYGGGFTLRYCYVHDSVQAENFHIRAHAATLEYNWFARAANYEGDLMTDDDYAGAGNGPFFQGMLLRGNIFIQNANPGNHSQVLVIDNDAGATNETMSMQIINNTYVGNGTPGNGLSAAFIHLANGDGTHMSALVMNNIISGNNNVALVDNAATGTVTGGNNWLTNGVSPGTLTNSVFAAAPVFNNPAATNYTLAANSAAIGNANQSIAGLPQPVLPIKEYFQNETNARQYRIRATARDIGALESTTSGIGIGPYDNPPAPTLSVSTSGGGINISWPFTAADFVLDQASTLGNPGNWSQVPPPYLTNATDFSITIPTPAANQFYQLKLP